MDKKGLILPSSPRKGGNIDGHPAREEAYQVGKGI